MPTLEAVILRNGPARGRCLPNPSFSFASPSPTFAGPRRIFEVPLQTFAFLSWIFAFPAAAFASLPRTFAFPSRTFEVPPPAFAFLSRNFEGLRRTFEGKWPVLPQICLKSHPTRTMVCRETGQSVGGSARCWHFRFRQVQTSRRRLAMTRQASAKPDSLKIAQPFMAGNNATQISKSHQGRQTISFVPDGTTNIPEP